MGKVSEKASGDIEREPVVETEMRVLEGKHECPYGGRFCSECNAQFHNDYIGFTYSCLFLASYTFYHLNLAQNSLRLETCH